MKYIVRSIKYFFYFGFLTCAIVTALVLIGAVEGNIESIFEGGYDALWKMAAFFAVVSAVYPSLSFIDRDVCGTAPLEEIKDSLVEFMRERGYEIEQESGGSLSFRVRGIGRRLSKMYEDRITISQRPDGIRIAGLRKDVIRLAAGIQTRFVPTQDQN